MQEKYIIDPFVIAIFMQTDNEDLIKNVYDKTAETMMDVTMETTADFLEKKGVDPKYIEMAKNIEKLTEEEIDAIEQSVKDLLKSDELAQRINDDLNMFNKTIYAMYLPQLPQEQVDRLNEYLETLEGVTLANKKLMLEAFKSLKNLVEQNALDEELPAGEDVEFDSLKTE